MVTLKPPHKSDAIAHIYSAHLNSGERFYLRMLLFKVPGASSFKALGTVNGVFHETFKAACLALGLLVDDAKWESCLQEASSMMSPKYLQNKPRRPSIMSSKISLKVFNNVFKNILEGLQ